MKTSKTINDMIKAWEGCRLKAYRCPAGVWTIGYGHTAGVYQGMTITQRQADDLFQKDIDAFARQVTSVLTSNQVTLRQCQFDAVTSFAYNVGMGNLKRSTLFKKLKANRDDLSIASEFAKWNKGGGKVLPGLTRRRAAEAKLYFSWKKSG